MPNAVVKSYAEKSGKSPEEIEKWWKEAEEESKKKFPKKGPHYWAYVNGIVKKRAKIKENVGFKDWLEVLNEAPKSWRVQAEGGGGHIYFEGSKDDCEKWIEEMCDLPKYEKLDLVIKPGKGKDLDE